MPRERREQLILDVAGQGVWVTFEGRTRFANPKMLEFTGLTLPKLVATPTMDIFDEESREDVLQYRDAVRSGQRVDFTARIRRADGSTFLAHIDGSPLFDHVGRYQGSVALVDDITERAEAERQARFRAMLLDSIGEAVAAADADRRLVFVNAAAERLFGWRAADVLGTDAQALIAAPGATEEATQIHTRLTGGKRFSGPLTLARRDGSEFDARISGAPAFAEDGSLIGLVAVITDESERTRLANERFLLEMEAEAVAVLGSHALRSGRQDADRPNAVLDEAIDALHRLLDTDHVAVLEVEADADKLSVLACSPGVAGPVAVPAGGRSFAGYTALTGSVVVVDDMTRARRFTDSPVWPGFQPTSSIGAPILSPDGVRGVVIAQSTAPRRFDQSAGHFIQAVANIVGAALWR